MFQMLTKRYGWFREFVCGNQILFTTNIYGVGNDVTQLSQPEFVKLW